MADIQRQGNAKPQTWQDGLAVSNALAVGDGTRAEAMAALGYGWDATSLTWVKVPVDHTTGLLAVIDNTLAGSQQSRNGVTEVSTHDDTTRVLLEQVLVELVVLNSQMARLAPSGPQADTRPDLRLAS